MLKFCMNCEVKESCDAHDDIERGLCIDGCRDEYDESLQEALYCLECLAKGEVIPLRYFLALHALLETCVFIFKEATFTKTEVEEEVKL